MEDVGVQRFLYNFTSLNGLKQIILPNHLKGDLNYTYEIEGGILTVISKMDGKYPYRWIDLQPLQNPEHNMTIITTL